MIETNKKLNKNFWLLWQGQLISSYGDVVYLIAMQFWILEVFNSTAIMGLISGILLVPRIFIYPFAGVLTDRFNKKFIMVLTDLVRGITIILFSIMIINDYKSINMIILFGILVGVVDPFFNPAVNAIIPEMLTKENMVKGNSLMSLAGKGSRIIGETTAGILYVSLGAPILFLLNGISFIYSGISEMFIRVAPPYTKSKKTTILSDFIEGLSFVKKFKGLKILYVMIMFMNFFGKISSLIIIALFYKDEQLGAQFYGIIASSMSIGIILGYVVAPIISKTKNFKLFVSGGIMSSISMIIFSITNIKILLILMILLNGLGISITNVLIQTSMQIKISDSIRGRVFGFRRTINSLLLPIAAVLGGVLGEVFNLRGIIMVSHICLGLLFVSLLFMDEVIEMFVFESDIIHN